MLVNIIKSYRKIVTICDSELLGKKFEEGKFQLDLKASFYDGKKYSEEKIRELIREFSVEDATFNIVGKRAVSLALKEGVFLKEDVQRIGGIPYIFLLL